MLEAIGLSSRKYLPSIYEGLCELVRERIQLAQKRDKARQTKVRGGRAEKKLAEEVLDELVAEGPQSFPEDFFSATAAADPKTKVELPDELLVLEPSPMFMGVHTKSGSFDRSVKSLPEGKFLLYAQRAGQKLAHLPDKPVEVARTVANYEKYLRELRKQFYEAYYRRTLDTKAAARLTQAAFDRFRLPAPEALG